MWRWSNVVIISASLGILVLPESVMWVIFTDCAFPHLERSRRILPSVNWPVEIAPGNILYCISYLYWHAGKDFIISCGKRGFTLFLRHIGTPGSGLFFSFTYWLMNNKTYMNFFFFLWFSSIFFPIWSSPTHQLALLGRGWKCFLRDIAIQPCYLPSSAYTGSQRPMIV